MSRTFASCFSLALAIVACGGSTTPDIDGGSDSGGGSDGSANFDGGAGPCNAGACTLGLKCCNNVCVNANNDPLNCGGCGTHCSGATPMCLGGNCSAQVCQPACGDGQVCCQIDGPGPSLEPTCYSGTTCPVGCPLCK